MTNSYSKSSIFSPKAVFFDLDGTLADTAQDLIEPILSLRKERGMAPVPFESLRPFASMGARGLILNGLGVAHTDEEFARLRDQFLIRYEKGILVKTKLFPGMNEVLVELEKSQIPWGVISNKIERYVRLIMDGLNLSNRACCAIGGDTTAHAKPHPAPLLYGASLARVDPSECVYVGDDLRDIEAGRAASMFTVAASYGFCGGEQTPDKWGADRLIHEPIELLDVLDIKKKNNKDGF